jgi:hypothetical protein
MRNFMEERRRQLIQDELVATIDRVFPHDSVLRDLYSQNPLLNLLLNVKRGSKSPYTQPIIREKP